MRIIVALADDRGIVESLRAAIPEHDLLVVESTVDDVLKRLVSTETDLVIVDDTPRLRPEEVVHISAAHPRLPILMLSARYDTESRAAFIVAGARRCVGKPFACEELLDAIEAMTDVADAKPDRGPASAVPTSAVSPSHVHQHQSALRWMSRHATQIHDPSQLARSVTEALTDVFDTSRAAVLLFKNGSARVVASEGLPESVVEPLRLSFSDGLMRWLEEQACLFDRRRHPEAHEAQKHMSVLKARLAFPIVVDGQTRGAVLLGEKANGSDFSAEERELLSIMTRSLAMSFERSRQYRDASRQRHRVDAVLAGITTGVITVRHDKSVSMMNEAAERLLGVRAAESLGRSVQTLGSVFADPILRTLRSGTPVVRERVDLSTRNLSLGISVTPVADEGVAAVFAAIPKESESAQAGDDSRFWEYLSSRVAQEIKNPMVAINTFAQLLPTKYDSQGFRDEFAEVVQSEVARINGVVEKLYQFARPADLSIAECDLKAEVKRALSDYEPGLSELGIGLETHFDEGDVPVAADSKLLTEAVQNILKNSIESMDEGGTLRVETKRDNGWCEVVIADSGVGVSEQDAPLIFLPFYSTKERGMGLGLTIAQRIAGQHKGRLDLLNTSADGSSFILRLPTAKQSEPIESPEA